jgi:acetyltransferase-like isoleucine patch superfamily enzyme
MGTFLGNVFGKIYRSFFFKKEENKFSYFTRTLLANRNDCIIGDYTYGNPEILEWNDGKKLCIGKYCSIAEGVKIFLGGNHRVDWLTTYPFNIINDNFQNAKDIKGHPASKGDVIIGNDVWIGYGAVILSGVTIGDGSVIGAFTVVSKNVDPYSIVVGNPMKEVKKRFSADVIDKLLALKWWDWEINKINDNVKILCSNDISKIDSLLSKLH